MDFTNSRALLKRAEMVIPSATQTFSKGPTQWVRGVSPHYLRRGEGAWVWDVDDNKFLDYLMALGPVILGYNHPRVNEAVISQLHDGAVFSQMHPLEVEVSELLCELIPCAEMVRFAKNGTDANSGAVRAARAYTGRDRVAVCGYHGWQDWYIATTSRDAGVPRAVKDLSNTFIYNDLESLRRLFAKYPEQFACVVMEPVGVEPPHEGYLEGVRTLCDQHGVILIFDEIVTGFRLDLGGAQTLFGVTPDLATFGKAMANGMPLSAVVGKRRYMEIFDEIFFSGTFGGETLALAACKATIEELREDDALNRIACYGSALQNGLRAIINVNGLNDVLEIRGSPARSVLAFPHVEGPEMLIRRSYFMQECVKRGLLYMCIQLPSAAHGDEELSFSLDVFREVMPLFASAYQAGDFADRLDGPPVEAVFRKV